MVELTYDTHRELWLMWAIELGRRGLMPRPLEQTSALQPGDEARGPIRFDEQEKDVRGEAVCLTADGQSCTATFHATKNVVVWTCKRVMVWSADRTRQFSLVPPEQLPEAWRDWLKRLASEKKSLMEIRLGRRGRARTPLARRRRF